MVGAACGEEDGKEDSSLEDTLCVCLNFSKSAWSSSICDKRSAIVGPRAS